MCKMSTFCLDLYWQHFIYSSYKMNLCKSLKGNILQNYKVKQALKQPVNELAVQNWQWKAGAVNKLADNQLNLFTIIYALHELALKQLHWKSEAVIRWQIKNCTEKQIQ